MTLPIPTREEAMERLSDLRAKYNEFAWQSPREYRLELLESLNAIRVYIEAQREQEEYVAQLENLLQCLPCRNTAGVKPLGQEEIDRLLDAYRRGSVDPPCPHCHGNDSSIWPCICCKQTGTVSPEVAEKWIEKQKNRVPCPACSDDPGAVQCDLCLEDGTVSPAVAAAWKKEQDENRPDRCPTCKDSVSGRPGYILQRCPTCDTAGTIDPASVPCPHCDGEGIEPGTDATDCTFCGGAMYVLPQVADEVEERA